VVTPIAAQEVDRGVAARREWKVAGFWRVPTDTRWTSSAWTPPPPPDATDDRGGGGAGDAREAAQQPGAVPRCLPLLQRLLPRPRRPHLRAELRQRLPDRKRKLPARPET
jgi:hypothetical protein